MRIVEPRRVTRSYTQRLSAPPHEVFPLLCPVREADWIEGWDPLMVYSASGVAEPGCVFTTPGETGDAVWVVTRHEPENGFVEMLKVTPGVTVCQLTIRLRPTREGCDADVRYTHTSLGPAGDAFVDSFTEAFYVRFMRQWETRLNHYLTHGVALREPKDEASPDMRVRPFRDDDEEAVVALWQACDLVRSWNDPVKDIARKLAVQREMFLVGVSRDRVVATAMAGYEGHRGWVNYLAVHPEFRRGGVGRALMAQVERRLLALGCPKVNVQVRSSNVQATRFYERLGYTQDEVLGFGKRLIPDEGAGRDRH